MVHGREVSGFSPKLSQIKVIRVIQSICYIRVANVIAKLAQVPAEMCAFPIWTFQSIPSPQSPCKQLMWSYDSETCRKTTCENQFCRFASICFPSWGPPIEPARPQLQVPLGKQETATSFGNKSHLQNSMSNDSPCLRCFCQDSIFLAKAEPTIERSPKESSVLDHSRIIWLNENTCDGMKVP